MQSRFFTHLSEISVGHDSKLELVELDGQKLVLKTFQFQQYQNIDPIIKRNREYFYTMELQNLGILSLKLCYLDSVAPNQLCFEYLENLQTFDQIQDYQQLFGLGQFTKNLLESSQNVQTKFVTKEGLLTCEKDHYFNWLARKILKRKVPDDWKDSALEIIEELKTKTEFLTLLHSDFHHNNIGIWQDRILLFDSGECPYLYGHRYHDLTRQLMYFPQKIIFTEETVDPVFAGFVEGLGEIIHDPDFQKFCFVQSILMANNTFVTRRAEISQKLYFDLSRV